MSDACDDLLGDEHEQPDGGRDRDLESGAGTPGQIASGEDDHLARITGDPGEGWYTTDRTTLWVDGLDPAADLIVWVHETHHQALNDATAYGSALHVLAALGRRAEFSALLGLCRTTHEAYATSASISVASTVHPDIQPNLDKYPKYRRQYERTRQLLAEVSGPHRRYLALTAAARVAMQTPIQELMLQTPTLEIRISGIRLLDRPDHRWRFLHRRPSVLAAAAARAGKLVRDTGVDLDEIDPPTSDPERDVLPEPADDGLSAGTAAIRAADDDLDETWGLWEKAVYTDLAAALSDAGATVLDSQGHLEGSVALVEAGKLLDPGFELRAAGPKAPAPDDQALASAAIARVRTTVNPIAPSRLVIDDASVAVTAGRQWRVNDQATLVVSARLPARMASSFAFDPVDDMWLREQPGPIVAVRGVGEGEGLVHAVVTTPGTLVKVYSQFRSVEADGQMVVIAAASCFVDTDWTKTWLGTFRQADLLVVSIDVVPDRFVPSWIRSGARVSACAAQIDYTSGVYSALALTVATEADPGGGVVWLFLSDTTTVRLLLDQLRRIPDLGLRLNDTVWTSNADLLKVSVTHLLATEVFFDLDGLDADTLRRAIGG